MAWTTAMTLPLGLRDHAAVGNAIPAQDRKITKKRCAFRTKKSNFNIQALRQLQQTIAAQAFFWHERISWSIPNILFVNQC
ncbi:MAG: hypothetical protein GY789_16990 [Hyphomicrobiales bacterium]|nr:hypothetical protein [Hyphomicrobiales bacterium]MCP5000420.1 hypothetical protein [Hyphomicrobiales bacterium]